MVLSGIMKENDFNLREVFRRVYKHNLNINLIKCILCKELVELLGQRMDREGVSVDQKKIVEITSYPVEQTVLR